MKTTLLFKFLRAGVPTLCAALLLGRALTAAAQTTAQTLYHVTIDTSQLQDHPAGAFSLEFTLIDGAGTGDGNSTIVLTNFNFGTNGVFNGEPDANGGVSGDLSTNVTLSDTSPENDFTEEFSPGTSLTFDVYATLSLDTNGISDEFEMAIVDQEGERIPTLDTNADNSLVRLTTSDGATISVESYGTDPTLEPVTSGPPVSFGPLVLLNGTTLPGTPMLNLGVNGNGTDTLQWPARFSNFTLQETSDFVTWSPVPIEASTVGTNYNVIVYPADAPYEFYRLAQ